MTESQLPCRGVRRGRIVRPSAQHSKCCGPVRVPWVRIPPPPRQPSGLLGRTGQPVGLLAPFSMASDLSVPPAEPGEGTARRRRGVGGTIPYGWVSHLPRSISLAILEASSSAQRSAEERLPPGHRATGGVPPLLMPRRRPRSPACRPLPILRPHLLGTGGNQMR